MAYAEEGASVRINPGKLTGKGKGVFKARTMGLIHRALYIRPTLLHAQD